MDEYKKSVLRTENKDYEGMSNRLQDAKIVRLEHAAHGMVTEAAEFMDQLKKHVFYNKKLDEVNLAEEIGDQLYYITVALDALGLDIQKVMDKNAAKLNARYAKGFTEDAAINRDKLLERKILEEK